jgi:hypothetical protein
MDQSKYQHYEGKRTSQNRRFWVFAKAIKVTKRDTEKMILPVPKGCFV